MVTWVDGAAGGTPLTAANLNQMAQLGATTQTFTGQQVVKRPTSATNTPLFTVVDETSNNRLTFSIIAGAATQLQVYAKAGEPAILGLIGANGTDYADFTFDGANCEIDVQGGDLNFRPLTSGKNVNIWSIAGGSPILKVGNQGLTQALTLQHDGTNAHVAATTGYVGFQGDTFQILSTGAVNYSGPTAISATAGTNGATPAQVGGYLTWQVGGTTVKIPYFFS